MRNSWLVLICLIDLCLIQNVEAAVIITRDGRRIFVDSYQERNGTIWYEPDIGGPIGKMGISANQVEKIIEDDAEIPSGNTIIVYGRKTCEWTVKYLNEFKNRGINDVIYKNIDNKQVAEKIETMIKKAGLDARYMLPVIEVGSQVFIRPDLNVILDIYNNNSNSPKNN